MSTNITEPVAGPATGPAPRPDAGPVAESAPGYRPGHTLPLRVEAMRQWRRRRTMVMALVLGALRSS